MHLQCIIIYNVDATTALKNDALIIFDDVKITAKLEQDINLLPNVKVGI